MQHRIRVPGSWLMATLLLVTACSTPTTTQEAAPEPVAGSEAGDQAGSAAADLEDVYGEVDGLVGEERVQRLAGLAQAEEGPFSFYTSMNLTESEPVTALFEDRFDIPVELYRAVRDDLLTRLHQEAEAGYQGADVVSTNAPEMAILDRDSNLLVPLQPAPDSSVPDSIRISDTWMPVYLNAWTPAWNTDLVAPENVPTTWREVMEGYEGRGAAIEPRNAPWFAALVTDWIENEDMTEEEAVELVRRGAGNAQAIEGHTTQAQLLSAGEFDLAYTLYVHSVEREKLNGAPVEWQPAVEPVFVMPQGIGVHAGARRPATALLFTEFLLSQEVQEMLVDLGRTPVDPSAPGGLGDLETVSVDVYSYLDEAGRWEDLYEQVILESS